MSRYISEAIVSAIITFFILRAWPELFFHDGKK